MSITRPAAVAGMFYPDNPAVLKRSVSELLAHASGGAGARPPKALIVPHAGYVYSGAVAASAYARLGEQRARIRLVVLLGPTHRVYVRGLALPDADCFATPLGEIPLDQAGMQRLLALPQVTLSAAAHQMEHSLEVQLPFLQQALDDFHLLPLAVGEATPEDVAEVLEAVWGGDETLIVISSDLSHFLPDAVARKVDGATVEAILALNPQLDHEQACGATPVNGLLLAARRHGLQPVVLDVRNSSDTAGDPQRVVGYAAFAFEGAAAAAQPQADDKGAVLLKLARAGIAGALGQSPAFAAQHAWLQAPGASFVTLTRCGELRGCIGTLEAHRPLGEDVRENAVAAAFRDPRFAPLSLAEFDTIRVEVSLLSAAEPMAVASEQDALASLRPHVDGVVFEYGHYRSTFLPQVWEQLPDPVEFLAQLKRKAGLSINFWDAGVRLSRYTVRKWKE
ncbi:MAG TPA: AmmeMemoRadiSam system protein B [Thiobacillus sp.]|nr:MAG: AMMECR1 domain-containing protein [Hydrogenophilales bacterium 28-61-11]OYZ58703.1 MAG: AMMECR1 domain-containing protein [Hydrogenophilales bacterium 16-61-112]OZA50959.1 MAG: AMMECR1 domain-containing protein [Hydrogenophilales bacterium 17-61-76]HQT30762.1 AmmeMemoRadiSam system protein B [Thiobacillus sp.]HQT69566.1 AmmeMemoRadiSam system protein B [Thiobacillus sp.]